MVSSLQLLCLWMRDLHSLRPLTEVRSLCGRKPMLLSTPWAQGYLEDNDRGKENLELKHALSSGSACRTQVLSPGCASRNFNQQRNQSSRDEGTSKYSMQTLEIIFNDTVLRATTSNIIERSPSFSLPPSPLLASFFLSLCWGTNLPTCLCNLSEP